MATLSASIVLYAPDEADLALTCQSLARAIAQARDRGRLDAAEVWLIDNGPEDDGGAPLRASAHFAHAAVPVRIRSGQGNVGYGRGHNLALHATRTDYHLVLNPDVELAASAIDEALAFMEAEPRVLMLSPQVRNRAGERLCLCKRYPSVFDFMLRGFAPAWLKRVFARRLARYEMREETGDAVVMPVPIVSGCFMFLRRAAIEASGGFDPAYFLYFEDFDLSWRLSQTGVIAYVPRVAIVHFGGHAARKGWHHLRLFLAAGRIFFGKHGWKLW